MSLTWYDPAMHLWEAAVWGLGGGFAVEAIQLYGAIRRVRGFPWKRRSEPGLGPYTVATVLRLAVGAIVATAAGSAGAVENGFNAFALGIAAPLLVENLSKNVRLDFEDAIPLPPTPSSLARPYQADEVNSGASGADGKLAGSETHGTTTASGSSAPGEDADAG